VSLKYRISNIGWYNFELLVQTLLKAVIGPGVTAFGGSKDLGRDATFVGNAAFPATECQWTGNWVFQVKYVDFEEQGIDAARSALKSTFRSELRKVLSRQRGTNNYILLTDVPLSTKTRSDLDEVIVASGFKGNFASVDGKDVCQLLDIHGDIRKSFPQLLALADLDLIVNRDLYARSQAYLEDWQPRLATYVLTEAHTRAMSLLKKEHFIVLDGPPEAGKTTIAAALALVHAADGFEIMDVRTSNDVFRASDERGSNRKVEERKRLFIADDAIGSISLVAAKADEWSRDLPGILRQLSSGRLLVWTARRYILEEALATSRLRDTAAEFPRPHEVIVEVGKLSTMQKAEILYNHAKQGNLSGEHRKLIRTHAMEIASHPNFTPLRIKELISVVLKPEADSSERLAVTWQEVQRFLSNPGERWIQAFRKLSQSEQTLLTAMLEFEGPTAERELRASYELHVSKREGGHLSFDECLARLDHSFLTVALSYSGERRVSMQHPSLRDMLLLELRQDIDARRRYISLVSPSGLAGMIGGIAERSESEAVPEHAVVPVNEGEFEIFLERLRNVSQGVLTLRDWELLLTACDRLIPRKPKDSAGLPSAEIEIWKLLGTPTERVEPVDLDVEAFAGTWMGRIIHAVLDGFSAKRTFENSQTFGDEEWVRLLSRFYTLSGYISPPIYPRFTKDLCDNLSRSIDSIRLANVINGAEPLVAKQRITRATVEEWKEELKAEATELKDQGGFFGDGDDPDEFDEWHDRSERFLDTTADFVRWGIAEQLNGVEELREVFESSERPHEPDPEQYKETELPASGPYWTVQRLFEDL
jgi:adenylate kinase family enzyme